MTQNVLGIGRQVNRYNRGVTNTVAVQGLDCCLPIRCGYRASSLHTPLTKCSRCLSLVLQVYSMELGMFTCGHGAEHVHIHMWMIMEKSQVAQLSNTVFGKQQQSYW